MDREREFVGRYREDLKRGRELCLLLQRGAVELVERRQRHLTELRTILKRIENVCRQIAHERGEDEIRGYDEFGAFPWLQVSNFFGAKVRQAVDRIAKAGRTSMGMKSWLDMGTVAQVFENGLKTLDRLAEKRSGNSSLTTRPTQSLLILPPYLRPKQERKGLIIP